MDNQDNKSLTVTKMFGVPREIVWKYWTDPKLVSMWWGPNGVTNPTCVWEAVVGGNIHIVMLAGKELGPFAGQEWPMTGKMLEVERHAKLVFTSNAIVDGKPVLETQTTVLLEENPPSPKATEGQVGTRMTVYVKITKTTPEAEGPLKGMEMGWNQQLDKLVARIATSNSK